MPDKKYTDLAKKGWNSMEAILDKEMPVKKDRRWLFLLLFLILGGFIGSFVYLGLGKPSDQVVLKKTIDYASSSNAQDDLKEVEKQSNLNHNGSLLDQSVIEVEAGLKDGEKSTKERSLAGNDGLEKNQFTKTVKEEPSTVRNLDEISGSEFEVSKSQSEMKNAAILNTNVIASNKIARIVDQDVETKGLKSSGSEVVEFQETSVNSGELFERRKIELVSPLNSIQNSNALPFYTEGTQYQDLITPLREAKKESQRYLSIYGGYSLPVASQVRGPSIGISMGQGLSKRWSLNTSLGLRFFSTNSLVLFNEVENSAIADPTVEMSDPGEFADNSDLGEDILVVESTDGRIALNQEYYDLVTEKLGNLNYLDLGLEGRYRLSRNFGFAIGLRYSYLLSSNTDFIGLSEFAPSLGQNAGGLESNVLISNNLLNRSNFGLNAGFRFELNRRLSLNATFNYGLNDIIKIDNRSDSRNKLNFLGLGFDYKLYM